MCHVVHMIATYEWIMLHMWLSSVAHMDGSYCTYEWVAPRIGMSPVAHINESCCPHEWVKLHIWMSHIAHTNESYYEYECVVSHTVDLRHSKEGATHCLRLQHSAIHYNTPQRTAIQIIGTAKEALKKMTQQNIPAESLPTWVCVALCCTACWNVLHSRQRRKITSPQQACLGVSLLQCAAQCVAQRVAQLGVVRCSETCEALLLAVQLVRRCKPGLFSV